MDSKLEWLIPFSILGVILIPKFLKDIPRDAVNDISILLVTCVLTAIVISVLRYLRKLENKD